MKYSERSRRGQACPLVSFNSPDLRCSPSRPSALYEEQRATSEPRCNSPFNPAESQQPSLDSLSPQLLLKMATRYSTATAFLEHASTADDFHYEVPSSAPLPKSAPPSLLAQADHALSSSTFFPPYARTDGFVLARIVEDAYQLELRWVAFSRRSQHQAVEQAMDEDSSTSPFADLDAHPGTLPPVRFIFPARLVPNPSFAILESTSQLQVYCLTKEGYLYVLSFPLESLFYQPTLANEPWSEEFRIESLAGRTPVLMQGVDEGRLVVGCADGFTVGLEIVRRAGEYPLFAD